MSASNPANDTFAEEPAKPRFASEAFDAEVALLAIADGLNFSGPPGSHSQALFGALIYKVQITHHTSTGSKWSAWYISSVGVASIGSFCETRFNSLEEGQAACNRHAATGKWDS